MQPFFFSPHEPTLQPDSNRVYLVLPSFTGFTLFYCVLLGFTLFYRVLLSFTGFYLVLVGFYGLYLVLLCIT